VHGVYCHAAEKGKLPWDAEAHVSNASWTERWSPPWLSFAFKG